MQHLVGHAAQEPPAYAGPTMGGHGNKRVCLFCGCLDNGLSRVTYNHGGLNPNRAPNESHRDLVYIFLRALLLRGYLSAVI
jgi:hypothetical protein